MTIYPHYGTGWRRDQEDKRDWTVGNLCGGVATPGKGDVDLRHGLSLVRNQFQTSSCVGQSLATAVQLRQLATGKECPFLSALDLYYHARLLEHGQVTRDDGTTPRAALKAAVKYGIADNFEWSQAHDINAAPSWSARQSGYARRNLIRYGRCGGAADVRYALRHGMPVQACWIVGTDFLRVNSLDTVTEMSGSPVGGHAMVAVATVGDDFLVQNSWGTNWGAGGFWRCSASLMRHARDVRAIR